MAKQTPRNRSAGSGNRSKNSIKNHGYYAGINASFIHSDHFYSASSSPLLFRSAPKTARILWRSFTPESHRQMRVKDLPKVPRWRLERDSNPRPSGRKTLTLPMRYHVQTLGRRKLASGSLLSVSH